MSDEYLCTCGTCSRCQPRVVINENVPVSTRALVAAARAQGAAEATAAIVKLLESERDESLKWAQRIVDNTATSSAWSLVASRLTSLIVDITNPRGDHIKQEAKPNE